MRSPEEIKNAMRGCHSFGSCSECPYFSFQVTLGCKRQRNADALAYIQQLEAERDAAISDLHHLVANLHSETACYACKRRADCDLLDDCDYVESDRWEWRGVQKEG